MIQLAIIAAAALALPASGAAQHKPVSDFGGAKPINPGTWIRASDYPIRVRQEHHEGDVKFSFDIDATGRVQNCQVTESSLNVDLDKLTCPLFTARARFRPRVDADGTPVATKGHSEVRWRLW